MKKIILAMLTLICFSSAAIAAVPDTIVLKASKGDIAFTHKKHQEANKDCKLCHASDAGEKIGKQGMGKGHKMCLTCHKEKSKSDCAVCHKK